MYAFIKELRHRNHTRRYTIQPTESGWQVLEEQDSRIVRQACYTDWHRVERARRAFALEVSQLKAQGWEPAGTENN
jgi:hypothetical protein